MKSKSAKQPKVKQQKLDLDEGISTKAAGFLYRFRKIESLIAVAPFWKSAFAWFVIAFDIFLYIVLFFFISDKIVDLPPKIPLLFYYPKGEEQLIEPMGVWYLYTGSLVFSIINLIMAGKLFQVHRFESWFLLFAELFKTLLVAVLIYKTFFNWVL